MYIPIHNKHTNNFISYFAEFTFDVYTRDVRFFLILFLIHILDRVHPVRYLFILCNINGAHVNDNFYHLKLGYYPKATCNYYLHKRF
jgi:hypothetical protein